MAGTIKAFLSSVGLHVVLLGMLLVTFNFDSGKAVLPPAANNLPEPVLAEVLDAAQVEQEVARLQALEDQKRQAEQDRQDKLKAEADAARKKREAEEKRLADLEKKRKAEVAKAEADRKKEQQRLADLEKKRKAEEQRKADLQKQRQAEEKRLQELAIQKQKQAEEKARLEAENKRIVEEKAKLEAQRLEEERKAKAAEAERKAKEAAAAKAEAERKAKEEAAKKAEAARKAKEAAEAKKRAEEEARRKALESELAAAIAAEENSGEQARDLEIYRGLIAQAVQRNWIRPESAKVAECVVRVTQIPGGEVIRVTPQANRCGGDSLFQRSVVKAVEDASPLPAPPNPDVFDREIEFLFRPQ